ncbi:uncharacterized protein CIMG_10023 [Coccidioides immitis RS]|uniref:Uncharacterized protein n=1 Tax=Coccidioides immitis (strain RS) TaxID=246410 RepID=J3K0N3_COCIM|nr:uncharacterized protein CIMG_10023 [Coccidioides immitis RS]EAS27418.3 hypothetical protein CIMG_10023 [Coccidioides immitis RS]
MDIDPQIRPAVTPVRYRRKICQYSLLPLRSEGTAASPIALNDLSISAVKESWYRAVKGRDSLQGVDGPNCKFLSLTVKACKEAIEQEI